VSPEIGAGGFHSYAGTLLFCGVALSIVALALRSPWLARTAEAPAAGEPGGAASRLPVAASSGHDGDNPAAPYLLAFLALVVAGLVSRAFSVGDHEPLFFIRPLVGAIVLAIYWPTYRQVTWRSTWRLSWFAVPVGLLVAALWLGIDLLASGAGPPPPTPPPFTLAIRMVATLLVVPLAEELAFRGFLARRVSGPAFEELSPRAISWVGLLISSVAFGLLHQRLLAGALAGLCYGLAYRLRGRLADAVIAHATTNAVLVILAVLTGAWGLWM
jgi:exosortase E/protease (VPEID-CTERM system)